MDLLDNPVWHALNGPQKTVAEHRSAASRYVPAIAPFSALPDAPDGAAWDDLRDLVGPSGVAVLFMPPPEVPDGWEELFRLPTLQMLGGAVRPERAAGVEVLTGADVEDMLALVERTQPGPFTARTIELGDYIGVRDDQGALIAMAGERMHPPGHREISAVCTDAVARGRGLASALVRDLVGRICDRGETPMLHVLVSNENAIRVYVELGFTVRHEQPVIGLRSPS